MVLSRRNDYSCILPRWKYMLSYIIVLLSLFLGWCLQFRRSSLLNVHPEVTRSWKAYSANRKGHKSPDSSPHTEMSAIRSWDETKYGRNYQGSQRLSVMAYRSYINSTVKHKLGGNPLDPCRCQLTCNTECLLKADSLRILLKMVILIFLSIKRSWKGQIPFSWTVDSSDIPHF